MLTHKINRTPLWSNAICIPSRFMSVMPAGIASAINTGDGSTSSEYYVGDQCPLHHEETASHKWPQCCVHSRTRRLRTVDARPFNRGLTVRRFLRTHCVTQFQLTRSVTESVRRQRLVLFIWPSQHFPPEDGEGIRSTLNKRQDDG
jgi:hypothetical protein